MVTPRIIHHYFTKQELWYHILMMPILFPIGNYFLVGPRYFQSLDVLFYGTVLLFFLYWLSIITLTITIREIINRFPEVHQTVMRTGVMFVCVGLLTIVLASIDVAAYHLFPVFNTPFNWPTVRTIVLLGLVFDVCLCSVLSLFYTYSRWQENQAESEYLKRMALQTQLDTLKSQVNPHFLFNCLNSLSSLIGEDKVLAEQFVDEMAKVYRYMLQANDRETTTLESETRFVGSYAFLLRTRYGKSISINMEVNPSYLHCYLPPLTLQTLIENALKHNSVSVEKPLLIDIFTADGLLVIRNNVQKRIVRVQTGQNGLSNLTAKYEMISMEKVNVYDNGQQFTVTLPLLTQPIQVP